MYVPYRYAGIIRISYEGMLSDGNIPPPLCLRFVDWVQSLTIFCISKQSVYIINPKKWAQQSKYEKFVVSLHVIKTSLQRLTCLYQ